MLKLPTGRFKIILNHDETLLEQVLGDIGQYSTTPTRAVSLGGLRSVGNTRVLCGRAVFIVPVFIVDTGLFEEYKSLDVSKCGGRTNGAETCTD